MQRYIEQLLEDLQNAHREEVAMFETEEELSIEQHLAEVEKWLEQGEPEHTFSYYSGIQKGVFPPVEKLTQIQIEKLIKGIRQLFFSWNMDVDIPKELEIAKTYAFMLQVFDKKVEIVTSGFVTIEFCAYNVEACPFEEHCICKKFDDSDANSEGDLTADFPF